MLSFGVVLPTYGPGADGERILTTALAAEKLGYDSVWLTDHLALPAADAGRFGHIYEAISTLAYLAGKTSTIRLGTSVLVLPQRNPVEIAKQIATIDNLSSGRVTLAVGVGWSRGEYANLGYAFRNRGRRMDEAIQVLKALWMGPEPVSFQGKYYQLDQAVISPQPAQPGGPPVWVGGSSPAALRRAAALGDGWHPNAHPPAELLAALDAVQIDRKAGHFAVCPRIHLDFNRTVPSDDMLHGPSRQVIDQLKAYQNAGITGAVIAFAADGNAVPLRAMEKFAAEVLPEFR